MEEDDGGNLVFSTITPLTGTLKYGDRAQKRDDFMTSSPWDG